MLGRDRKSCTPAQAADEFKFDQLLFPNTPEGKQQRALRPRWIAREGWINISRLFVGGKMFKHMRNPTFEADLETFCHIMTRLPRLYMDMTQPSCGSSDLQLAKWQLVKKVHKVRNDQTHDIIPKEKFPDML